MKAIGVPVKWTNGDAEKRMTGADWLTAIEMYKPTVRIVEVNVPRAPRHSHQRRVIWLSLQVTPCISIVTAASVRKVYIQCQTSVSISVRHGLVVQKEARKDGWRISKDKTRAFAPGHKVLRINK